MWHIGPTPPQEHRPPMRRISFPGAAQPGYQTCFDIAPSKARYLGKEATAQPKARCVRADYPYTRQSVGAGDRPLKGLRSWVNLATWPSWFDQVGSEWWGTGTRNEPAPNDPDAPRASSRQTPEGTQANDRPTKDNR